MTRLLTILFLSLAATNAFAHTNEVTITTDTMYRYINSNGIPDHKTGAFPNKGNPNTMAEQDYKYRMPLKPVVKVVITQAAGYRFGVALNGVPFDPGTAEWWMNTRASGWNYDALSGKIDLGVDQNNAHVQPNGAYHYHGIPTAIAKREKNGHSVLIGYAADGFPIYALYGFERADNPSSKVIELRSSYRLRDGQRPSGPPGSYDGTFVQDFIYQAGSGDLDECNGREGVTPEYLGGTYAYFLTKEFPFVPRCFRGTPDPSFSKHEGPPPGASSGGRQGPGGQSDRASGGNMGPPTGGRQGGAGMSGMQGPPGGGRPSPPPEALTACVNKSAGDGCTFEAPHGTITGSCRNLGSDTACVPNDRPPGGPK